MLNFILFDFIYFSEFFLNQSPDLQGTDFFLCDLLLLYNTM